VVNTYFQKKAPAHWRKGDFSSRSLPLERLLYHYNYFDLSNQEKKPLRCGYRIFFRSGARKDAHFLVGVACGINSVINQCIGVCSISYRTNRLTIREIRGVARYDTQSGGPTAGVRVVQFDLGVYQVYVSRAANGPGFCAWSINDSSHCPYDQDKDHQFSKRKYSVSWYACISTRGILMFFHIRYPHYADDP
jgi:hypothetical protein